MAVAVYMIQILRALKANSLSVPLFCFQQGFPVSANSDFSSSCLFVPFRLGLQSQRAVLCPVAEAKFSQDLANPSHFTVNVKRKSKPSHLHFVLRLSEPIDSPGRGDPRMLCPHSWGMAHEWVILYLPQNCSRQTEEPRSGSENPHGVQGCRQISTSDLGNPRKRNQC